MRIKIITILLAITACICWFRMTREQGLGSARCQAGPQCAIAVLNPSLFNSPNIWPAWRTRIASLVASGGFFEIYNPKDSEQFKDAIGLYQSIWLAMTFTLCICFLKEPIFIILATFFGMACAYSNFWAEINIMPWDRPEMFFWTLCPILWFRKNYWSMMIAVIIGSAFKETVAVVALLVLFSDCRLMARIRYFALAFLGCLLIRLAITHFVLGSADINTARLTVSVPILKASWYFFTTQLFMTKWNNFIWYGGGLLFICLALIPSKTRQDKGIWFTLLAFTACIFTICIMDMGDLKWINDPNSNGLSIEPRQFVCLLPLCAIQIQKFIHEK